MWALADRTVLDAEAPERGRSVPRPLLIGDIAAARAGVPELLIQMARSEDRDDPEPIL
jgi:hypothetical protein